MTKEIIFIVDESTSMEPQKANTISGYNEFLQEQQKLTDECNITLVAFNSSDKWGWRMEAKSTEEKPWRIIYKSIPVKDARPLTNEDYNPCGMTALLDTMCDVIDEMGTYFSSYKTPVEKVYVGVITDGISNSDNKYTKNDVKNRVKHQSTKYGWTFDYFGANVDAFSEAGSIGIQSTNSYDVNATRDLYTKSINFAVTSFRSS